MFASLRRTFQRDRQAEPERIEEQPRITGMLDALRTSRELVCVRVPGCEQAANSAILDVGATHDSLYLDELNVGDTHAALLQRRQLTVECRLQSMRLQFSTRLLDIDAHGGLTRYRVALPTQILRMQRREHYRFELGTGLLVPIRVPDGHREAVKGEVFDLSVSGVGAFLQCDKPPAAETPWRGVTLALPKNRPLKVTLEVRFARPREGRRLLHIGARFVALERDQETRIARFIAEQQRKRRRHRPR